MEPVKCCVIGAGLASTTFHVPFILALPKLFTLHSVLERNPPTSGPTICSKFRLSPSSVILHRTLASALSDSSVELVLIGTPNDTHYSLAKAALEAGKHVLVDKPVTPTVEEAKELGELAKKNKRVLYAFQNRRWDQDFLALKRLLDLQETDDKSLGTVIEFESHFDRYRQGLKGSWKDEPRPAAGLIYDLGSHLIDQALTLFGRPTGITAFADNLRGIGHPDVEDNFTIYLHYPAGSALPYPFTAILRAHPLSARAPQIRFLVRGQKGSYTKYGVDIQEEQLKALTSSSSSFGAPSINMITSNESGYGFEPESLWGTLEQATDPNGSAIVKSVWPSKDAGCYTDLYRNLAEVIRGAEGVEMKVKWEEATAVIEMIELAKKSSKERRTVDVPK
ncbi:oxidoreductase [Rhodocollybia butyracea]|uniref:Oxidoreductase n=1 Tax=Rhodocollybia butyracea TaxID=206335 RepID=A0A9P5Q7B3_9AGAR|nr:oxidoreductase [Rhodocollybia butyracea]